MRAPEFWTSGTLAAKTCAALLSPCGALYGASVRLREYHARPYRARARVICVGNLTAGGSGKTPVAIALGDLLADHGNIIFLTRGYGGRLDGPVVVDASRHTARDTGDEPLLLARHHRTIVARDRAAGARLADTNGADFIIMDDGFQNFRLAKDYSLLVVDGESGFGNGKLIPAGPLREPVHAGLARANAIVLTGSGDPALPPFNGPILRARFVPENLDYMRGRKVMAFAGIGRPGKFFSMLSENGVELIGARAFPDHHMFTRREVAELKNQATNSNALLVTTEKDFVRLDPSQRDGIETIAIHASFDGSFLEFDSWAFDGACACPLISPKCLFIRRVRYLIETGAFFIVIGFFRLFDIDRASAIGGWIGRSIVGRTFLSGRARRNLRLSFPEKSEAEIAAILDEMWDNLGRVMAEYAHFDKICWRGPNPRITIGDRRIFSRRPRSTGQRHNCCSRPISPIGKSCRLRPANMDMIGWNDRP